MRYLIIWLLGAAALTAYSIGKHWDMISGTLGQAWNSTMISMQYIAMQGFVIFIILMGIVLIFRAVFR